jgi:phosphatidylethanolamine-binding protein (PEBP) family uncharacterized protein
MMRRSYSLTTFLALAIGAGTLSLSNCGDDGDGGGTGGTGGTAGTGGGGGRGGGGGGGGTGGGGGSGGAGGSGGSATGGTGGRAPDAGRMDGRTPDSGGGDRAAGDGGRRDGGSTADSGGAAGAFTLTVTEVDMRGERLVFRNGQTNGTGNRSPAFEWSAHPQAMSYALSMVDQCNNGTHWVMFDIPATVTKLPAALMRNNSPDVPEVPGAKQTRFSGGNPYGYFGPGAGSCNRYNFIVHAINKAALGVSPMDKNAVRGAVFNNANRIAATPQVQVVGNNGAGMCTGALGCGP